MEIVNFTIKGSFQTAHSLESDIVKECLDLIKKNGCKLEVEINYQQKDDIGKNEMTIIQSLAKEIEIVGLTPKVDERLPIIHTINGHRIGSRDNMISAKYDPYQNSYMLSVGAYKVNGDRMIFKRPSPDFFDYRTIARKIKEYFVKNGYIKF